MHRFTKQSLLTTPSNTNLKTLGKKFTTFKGGPSDVEMKSLQKY